MAILHQLGEMQRCYLAVLLLPASHDCHSRAAECIVLSVEPSLDALETSRHAWDMPLPDCHLGLRLAFCLGSPAPGLPCSPAAAACLPAGGRQAGTDCVRRQSPGAGRHVSMHLWRVGMHDRTNLALPQSRWSLPGVIIK